ncbi:hypothetical protein STEG23_011433 [Scotinomys teguina]
MWSILEKVPCGAEKQKDGSCFRIHSANLCLFIGGYVVVLHIFNLGTGDAEAVGSLSSSPSLLLYLPPRVLRLISNVYTLSSWRADVFSSCSLNLAISSSSPCPAFLAINQSDPLYRLTDHTSSSHQVRAVEECADTVSKY